jgi:hypothetical protein
MATAVLGGAAPFASVKFCGRVEPGAQRDSRRYRKRESALPVGFRLRQLVSDGPNVPSRFVGHVAAKTQHIFAQ